jgi:CDP-4-dehydro-6-deoxyglucose reductase
VVADPLNCMVGCTTCANTCPTHAIRFPSLSPPDRPLLFVAGGTGFAPIKALIEQQLKLAPQREMQLFWGMRDLNDCYAFGLIVAWARQYPNLHIVLAAERRLDALRVPHGVMVVDGNVTQALRQSPLPIAGHDAYVAGPPGMIPYVFDVLHDAGISAEHVVVDSFGLELGENPRNE